jgi:hypothetical protein
MESAGKPERNERAAITRRYGWTALLIIIFIAAVTVAGILRPAKPTDAVSFGFVPEPRAYGACGLSVNKPDAVLSYENYDDLISGLNVGVLDAALLPVQYLEELADGRYTVAAVVCYMNLVAVENGSTVLSIADLNGRRVVMPKSLEGTLEVRMLDSLLSYAGVSAHILFVDDDAVQQIAQDKDFDIMMLPADRYAVVFPRGGELKSCFDLADQWSSLMGSRPPAGCCVVVRSEIMGQRAADISDMLSKIRATVKFLKSKRKKAAVFASASGFGADLDYIRRTIPRCRFEYLEGDAMAESLEQLQSLRQAAAP